MSLTSELLHLIRQVRVWQNSGLKSVLATVVHVEGSSYRRPGVRMIINENDEMAGAVSGGCVEKEILRQTSSVFSSGLPKVMTYDGRFRLGCEGIIYVIIEPIRITSDFHDQFESCLKERKAIDCSVYYSKDIDSGAALHAMGTVLTMDGENHYFRDGYPIEEQASLSVFKQELPPIFQLYIFGLEHDAAVLCETASKLGWDVHLIGPPDAEKEIRHFKGAKSLSLETATAIDLSSIDMNSAVVLMSHSLNQDIQYLWALRSTPLQYIGILGPSHRRERIFNELLNLYPEGDFDFFDRVRSPVGIDLGAESPAEIAISIVSEILMVKNDVDPQPLHLKRGRIHE